MFIEKIVYEVVGNLRKYNSRDIRLRGVRINDKEIIYFLCFCLYLIFVFWVV